MDENEIKAIRLDNFGDKANEVIRRCLAEITRLQSVNQKQAERIRVLESERRWHQYIEGDTSTYPTLEDWYLIVIEGAEFATQEYYSHAYGWATDKKIIGWAYQPNPVDGEAK